MPRSPPDGTATRASAWSAYTRRDSRALPLTSDAIGQAGINYSLPVDVFGVIAANRERAQQDLASAELLARQQTLLKLHQASSDYFSLQALLSQKEALVLYRRRVEATHRPHQEGSRTRQGGRRGRELCGKRSMRLAADETALQGAVTQAQADLQEASGAEKFLPKRPRSMCAARVGGDGGRAHPAGAARPVAARSRTRPGRAKTAAPCILPSAWTPIISATHGNGDNRDTWAVGGVVSLPLGVSAYKQSEAQNLNALAAAEQSRRPCATARASLPA